MSSPTPVTAEIYRWSGSSLELLDYCDMTGTAIVVATSFLVDEGRVLALAVHRERFLEHAIGAEEFWDAAIAAIPRSGQWFPRVEFHDNGRMLFRLRSAPPLSRSLTLAAHRGSDPRTVPGTKGPDLEAMLRLRTEAQAVGATEAAILDDDGFVVETSQSSLVWWRGAILRFPPADFERVASVTARSLIGLATALGVETLEEAVTPAELDGTELWALNALHGARIVTGWVDGPATAELPGRLAQWRTRLGVLSRPLDAAS